MHHHSAQNVVDSQGAADDILRDDIIKEAVEPQASDIHSKSVCTFIDGKT